MIWLNRILVLLLMLCVSRTPIPWGHSHQGMDAQQLAVHLQQYHPATAGSELPCGWHWHLARVELATDDETGRDRAVILEECRDPLLIAPAPVHAGLAPLAGASAPISSTGFASAQAVRRQQTYLRFNVLLI